MHLANRAGDFRRSDAITNSPSGYRISLGHRVHDHRALAHACDLCHRDMGDLGGFAGIENVFVDLVSKTERVKFLAQSGDELHLSARKDLAGRIVGIADNYGSCLWIESCAQFLAVETPVRRTQSHMSRARVQKESRRARPVFIEGSKTTTSYRDQPWPSSRRSCLRLSRT